ncbi:uncharacterized protein LOC115067902 [Nannospalax galili]|uniref:uncharacterized protein LOC115067902 n=1 Tax=Nannospalax galili TaxID=1026970 RepID=UPI00111C1F42|nr:uncharacterized protein LOC115067902 [Nannospalax galili]
MVSQFENEMSPKARVLDNARGVILKFEEPVKDEAWLVEKEQRRFKSRRNRSSHRIRPPPGRGRPSPVAQVARSPRVGSAAAGPRAAPRSRAETSGRTQSALRAERGRLRGLCVLGRAAAKAPSPGSHPCRAGPHLPCSAASRRLGAEPSALAVPLPGRAAGRRRFLPDASPRLLPRSAGGRVEQSCDGEPRRGTAGSPWGGVRGSDCTVPRSEDPRPRPGPAPSALVTRCTKFRGPRATVRLRLGLRAQLAAGGDSDLGSRGEPTRDRRGDPDGAGRAGGLPGTGRSRSQQVPKCLGEPLCFLRLLGQFSSFPLPPVDKETGDQRGNLQSNQWCWMKGFHIRCRTVYQLKWPKYPEDIKDAVSGEPRIPASDAVLTQDESSLFSETLWKCSQR